MLTHMQDKRDGKETFAQVDGSGGGKVTVDIDIIRYKSGFGKKDGTQNEALEYPQNSYFLILYVC